MAALPTCHGRPTYPLLMAALPTYYGSSQRTWPQVSLYLAVRARAAVPLTLTLTLSLPLAPTR